MSNSKIIADELVKKHMLLVEGQEPYLYSEPAVQHALISANEVYEALQMIDEKNSRQDVMDTYQKIKKCIKLK